MTSINNIKLVLPNPEDAWFWAQVRNQKSTQMNNPMGVLSEERLRAQLTESNLEISARKSVHRYFIQLNNGDFAGVIALRDINWDSGVCELGYLIAEKYQNQGVASLAVEVILQKAFEAGIKKIKATTFVKNPASFKVLQKNGFELEGYLRKEVLIQGELEDMYLWATYAPQSTRRPLNENSGMRRALLGDAEVIHKLSHQLGYSPSLSEVQDHLSKMIMHPDYEVVVIEKNNEVLGWMSLYKRMRIEDTGFLQVAALVTDEKVRGQGLGKSLMNYAEFRAKELHLPFVGLHSSMKRKEAHRFYEGMGYLKAKESYFFKKDLH